MNTKRLKWRLANRPTPDEVSSIFDRGLITKEEAREILFTIETEEDRDKKGLESEIKFLRELVEKLSNNQSTKIIETIRQVEKPYYQYDWYKPYIAWTEPVYYGGNGTNTTLCISDTTTTASSNSGLSFSSIKTF